MYQRYESAFVYIKRAVVGAMNDQCNSIKMHGINNVRINSVCMFVYDLIQCDVVWTNLN